MKPHIIIQMVRFAHSTPFLLSGRIICGSATIRAISFSHRSPRPRTSTSSTATTYNFLHFVAARSPSPRPGISKPSKRAKVCTSTHAIWIYFSLVLDNLAVCFVKRTTNTIYTQRGIKMKFANINSRDVQN